MILTQAQRQAVTPFQARVYEALLQVDQGHVTTYKNLGAAIGCRSSQAIGQALRRNPFAPTIPCHRVVKTDLTLGGFGGSWDRSTDKRKLLESEGVQFHQDPNGGEWRVDADCVFHFK
jgi:methylated-DNA-[protein]-cysteine S-methyltransferase